MIYLALGDSITFGYNASNEHQHYTSVLTKKLNTLTRTTMYVHAKPGWTSAQLQQSLHKIPPAILLEAGLVTLMIGGNDLLKVMPWFLDDADAALAKLRESFLPRVQGILAQVHKNPDVVTMICTVYNPFPKLDIADKAVGGLNEVLRAVALDRGCLLVPIDRCYGGMEEQLVHGFRRGELHDFRLVKNPIHPNDEGHRQIAEAIFAVYQQTALSVNKHKNGPRTASGKRRSRRFANSSSKSDRVTILSRQQRNSGV